jgi:hypothetical protein
VSMGGDFFGLISRGQVVVRALFLAGGMLLLTRSIILGIVIESNVIVNCSHNSSFV